MGTVEGPWRGRLLLCVALLAAGCGGGEAAPRPGPSAPAKTPAPAPPKDAPPPNTGSPPALAPPPPPTADEADLPDPPILPFPAPGEDPDFPAKIPAAPGDWLDRFDEPGETVEEYRASCRNRLAGVRRRILLQPLGDLAKERGPLLGTLRDHLAAFFPGATVVLEEPLPLDPGAWREARGQYFAPALLAGLGRRLRGTTLACLALCAEDLYAEDLNFVFGLASPRLRTGVFSLRRYGGAGGDAFLRRALKVAVHETGHLLGLEHCVRYECVMNGANHLGETDRSPLHECPECGEKLRWNLGFDPAARWEGLAASLDAAGLAEEAAFARRRAGKSRSR